MANTLFGIAVDCNDTDIEGTSSTLPPDGADLLPARRASTGQPRHVTGDQQRAGLAAVDAHDTGEPNIATPEIPARKAVRR